MKKHLAVLVSAALLAGCGGGSSTAKAPETTNPEIIETIDVTGPINPITDPDPWLRKRKTSIFSLDGLDRYKPLLDNLTEIKTNPSEYEADKVEDLVRTSLAIVAGYSSQLIGFFSEYGVNDENELMDYIASTSENCLIKIIDGEEAKACNEGDGLVIKYSGFLTTPVHIDSWVSESIAYNFKTEIIDLNSLDKAIHPDATIKYEYGKNHQYIEISNNRDGSGTNKLFYQVSSLDEHTYSVIKKIPEYNSFDDLIFDNSVDSKVIFDSNLSSVQYERKDNVFGGEEKVSFSLQDGILTQ